MTNYRTEVDSMGEVQVPANAYYSAQTQRAVENFPISGWQLPVPLIRGMGRVKLACAKANNDLGKLTLTGKNRLSIDQPWAGKGERVPAHLNLGDTKNHSATQCRDKVCQRSLEDA